MAIILNTRKFYESNTKLVGYTISSQNDGIAQETLSVKTVDPLSEIRAITWTMSSTAGRIALYWQGNTAPDNVLITYITAPTGIFDLEGMFLKMKTPPNCTGHVLLSTEDFANKETYTLIVKAKEV